MKVIRVQMFGNFKISLFDEGQLVYALEEDDFHSPSVVNLLTYIIKNHTKSISTQELTENLFSEDESDNPVGTLKNLIYRLRTILKKMSKTEDFILTGKKAYYWNPDLPLEIDTELYLKYIQEAKETKEEDIRREKYLSAFRLYTSSFLPRHEDEFWVVCASASYESAYRTLTRELCTILEESQEYTLMEEIAAKALEQDNLSEEYHCFFIRALIGQDKMNQALERR